MSGLMSRNKGKRAEREIVAVLQKVVNEVSGTFRVEPKLVQRNTIQSDRGGFDLVGVPFLAPEVKHCETFNLKAWWEQCSKQASEGTTPVLFYRRNKVPWRVRMLGWTGGHGHKFGLPALVDISLEDFVLWFEGRYTAFLKEGK